MNIPLALVHLY